MTSATEYGDLWGQGRQPLPPVTEPKWFQALRLRYQPEGLFFCRSPAWGALPQSEGIHIMWCPGYRDTRLTQQPQTAKR